MPDFDLETLAPVDKAQILEAAEHLRRLAMRYFPKRRSDLEAGATCLLAAKNGKNLFVQLGELKGAPI